MSKTRGTKPPWDARAAEVLVPGATWTDERLDELAARASAWLAEEPGDGAEAQA